MTRKTALLALLYICELSNARRCDQSVSFEVQLANTWTSISHPKNYPGSAHLSPPIAVSHNASFHLWEPGIPAPARVKHVAELGDLSMIASYVEDAIASGLAHSSDRLGGALEVALGESDRVWEDVMQLEMNLEHRYVSSIYRIADSPDWFSGLRDVNLCNETTGEWVESLEVATQPYDAGTDCGASYLSVNCVQDPALNVFPITTATSNGGIFVSSDGVVKPVGRWKFIQIASGPGFNLNWHEKIRHDKVTITQGDNITWTWTDDKAHSVKSINSPQFPSSDVLIGKGSLHLVVFDTPGLFTYVCGVQGSSMHGQIEVLGKPTAAPDLYVVPSAAPTPSSIPSIPTAVSSPMLLTSFNVLPDVAVDTQVTQLTIRGAMAFVDINSDAIWSVDGKAAFSSTIANNTVRGVAAADINVITTAGGSTRSANSHLRKLATSVTVIDWAASLIVERFPEFENVTALYLAFTENLDQNVASGDFVQQLVDKLSSRGVVVGVGDFASVNSSIFSGYSVQFIQFSESPTVVPTSTVASSTSGGSFVAYKQQWFYVLSCIVVFLLFLCLMYILCGAQKRDVKNEKLEEHRDGGVSDQIDHSNNHKSVHERDILLHFDAAARSYSKFSGISLDNILDNFNTAQLSAWVHIQMARNAYLRAEARMTERPDDPEVASGQAVLSLLQQDIAKDISNSKVIILIAAFELYEENKEIESKHAPNEFHRVSMHQSLQSQPNLGGENALDSVEKELNFEDILRRHKAAAVAFSKFSYISISSMSTELCLAQLSAWAHVYKAKNVALRKDLGMVPRIQDLESKENETILVSLRGSTLSNATYSHEQYLMAVFKLYDETKIFQRKKKGSTATEVTILHVHSPGISSAYSSESVNDPGFIRFSKSCSTLEDNHRSTSYSRAPSNTSCIRQESTAARDSSLQGSFQSEAGKDDHLKESSSRAGSKKISGIFGAIGSAISSFAYDNAILPPNRQQDVDIGPSAVNFSIGDIYSFDGNVEYSCKPISPSKELVKYFPQQDADIEAAAVEFSIDDIYSFDDNVKFSCRPTAPSKDLVDYFPDGANSSAVKQQML